MKVHEFMTSKIEFVEAGNSVYDAVEKMVDRRIRSVAVRFSGKEPEYGVITARDIVFKVLAKGINPKDIKASEIASRPIICVEQDTGFRDMVALMNESNVARVFICEGKKLVGVVSLLDVMAATLIMRARGDHVA
jgi:signal-transduction protein with cAMP-binding, CBS, and nucleotidyltransferase domain